MYQLSIQIIMKIHVLFIGMHEGKKVYNGEQETRITAEQRWNFAIRAQYSVIFLSTTTYYCIKKCILKSIKLSQNHKTIHKIYWDELMESIYKWQIKEKNGLINKTKCEFENKVLEIVFSMQKSQFAWSESRIAVK